MTYILTAAEHDVYTDPPRVVNVSAGAATEIFPNEQHFRTGEIVQRLIQNIGPATLWYSEGISKNTGDVVSGDPQCDSTVMFHGQLLAGQQLDCSSHRQRVCVFCTTATQVSTTVRRRRQYTKITSLGANGSQGTV